MGKILFAYDNPSGGLEIVSINKPEIGSNYSVFRFSVRGGAAGGGVGVKFIMFKYLIIIPFSWFIKIEKVSLRLWVDN